ncbi:MAG: complex I subunit 5 family protein [Candidatus Wenzhouxiangella sp. M2_3B_020]
MIWLPVAAIALPVLVAAWIALAAPGRRAAAFASVGAAAATALTCMGLAFAQAGGVVSAAVLTELVPPIGLRLRVDALGALFALTVALLYVPATVHAAGWLAADRHPRSFHAVFLGCLSAMLLVAFADDLVTLLVGYELFSLASVILIVHRRTDAAFRAGLKYLVYVVPGGAVALIGILLVFHDAGSVAFTPGGLEGWRADETLQRTAWACLVLGFGVKAAIFGLHGWVPDAHPAAPAPFSAVLSGVMVATGVFAIVRVLHEIFGAPRLEALGVMPWLAIPAGFGVVAAGALAVGEDHFKRRLAYSTISQMGYATLAVSLLEPQALAGALVHLANHAFIKGGLFFAAGAIAAHAGVHRVTEMRGLSRRMPATAAAITLLALALIGLPPLAGFVGKWLFVSGAAEAGRWTALAVLLAGSVLSAMYLWPVVREIWSAPAPGAAGESGEPRDAMLAATLSAAVLAVLLGVAASPIGFPLDFARHAAGLLLGGTLP